SSVPGAPTSPSCLSVRQNVPSYSARKYDVLGSCIFRSLCPGLHGQFHRRLMAAASALLSTGVLTLRGTPGRCGLPAQVERHVQSTVKDKGTIGPLGVAPAQHPIGQREVLVDPAAA